MIPNVRVGSGFRGTLLRCQSPLGIHHHIRRQGLIPAAKSPHPSRHPEPCWGRPAVHAGPALDVWGVSFHAAPDVMVLVTHPATAFRPVRSPALAVTSRQPSGWSVMAILQPSAPSPPRPLASQGESRLLMPPESSPATGPVCSPPRRTEQGCYLAALGITPRWLALSIGRHGGG